MARTEIKIGGLGGQGVILSGLILGKAASIHDNKSATMTQAFGPEARGSAVSAQLIIDDEQVLYPYVEKADYMVLMCQEAYIKYIKDLKADGSIIIEKDLVEPTEQHKGVFAIPATRYAEELGVKMVVNIVMLGFFTAVTGLVSRESALKSVTESVPARFLEVNTKAFNKGYEEGLKQKEAAS